MGRFEGADSLTPSSGPALEGYDAPAHTPEQKKWLNMARDAYTASATWMDSAIRADTERALDLFYSRHPAGSKYHTAQYDKRSKIFRPKLRASMRRNEAAMSVAVFSTADVVHCSALDENDKEQRAAAEVHNAILNYRLTNPEQIPWFKLVIAGAQSAMTAGVVISRQTWKYRETDVEYEEQRLNPETGEEETIVAQETEILDDRPHVELIPIENIRVDPACDWLDPINSSPYIIELMPMYIYEVKANMGGSDESGRMARFMEVEDGVLHSAMSQDWDSVRAAREGNRPDKYDNDIAINDFSIVWVHRNIANVDGKDLVWYTLGTEFLLSEPRPIEEEFLHGIRPYVWGQAVVEAHKHYPSGLPKISEGLVEQANDIVNSRIDNVKLAMNKRFHVKRGVGVDVRSLVRNVSGAVTMMNDPDRDVKVIETNDVTASAYQEQDRVDSDMDEIMGTFSGSSVSQNRRLGETVGGMNLLNMDANQMTEYVIRTISETWLERVLNQLVRLEAAYETDKTVLTIAGKKAGGMSLKQVLDVLDKPTLVRINIGYGATNPIARVQKMSMGLNTVSQFMPHLMAGLDAGEVIGEVFGALGYRDGKRFFPMLDQEDAKYAGLMQQIQELQGQLQSEQAKYQTQIQVAQLNAQGKALVEEIRNRYKGPLDQQLMSMQRDKMHLDALIKVEQNETKRKEYELQREALSHSILEKDRQFRLSLQMSGAQAGQLPGLTPETKGAFDLPGNDAGKVTRDQYGMIPNAEEAGGPA